MDEPQQYTSSLRPSSNNKSGKRKAKSRATNDLMDDIHSLKECVQ